MLIDVVGRGGGGHQRHVVKGREQDAAIHGVEMHEAFEFEVHGIVGFGAILRRLGGEEIFGAAAEAGDVPGHIEVFDSFFDAGGPAFGDGHHAVKGFLGEDFRQRRAHGGEGERVAGERATDSAGIAVFEAVARGDHVGDFLREAVGCTGHAAADGLADYEHVGVEIFGASIAAGPSADGVSFIDDKKCAVLAGEIAERLYESRARAGRCRHW